MSSHKIPEHYQNLKARYPKVMDALEALGSSIRTEGSLDEKTGHLIQLGAATVLMSEGAVHSHTRRALEAGATADEIYHALLLLISTVGFPKVAAAISWAEDVIKK